jgi:peptidoglycan/LPS O-acetylase OafA/YrhL
MPQPAQAPAQKTRFPLTLRRITTDGSWIRELDGLRFVAIVSVVLYHLLGQLLLKSGHPVLVQPRYALLVRALGNGDRGVRLFFTISGFVLGLAFGKQHLLRQKRVDLKKYFLRRVTRLEPPYIINLVVCALAAFVYYHQSTRYLLAHLGASILYLHNLVYRTPSAINGVAWSLEVEIQFYILAPIIALLFLIRGPLVRRIVYLALMAAAGVWQVATHMAAGLGSLSLAYYVQYFLAGMLLTDLYLIEFSRWGSHRAWDWVSLLGWPVVFLAGGINAWFHAVLPFLLVPLYIAAFKGVAFRRFFSNGWIATIGGMCYSIYLWHFFVIGVFFRWTRHAVVFKDFLLNYCTQALLLGIPIAAVSLAAFLLVERPCMNPRWPTDLWRSLRGNGQKTVA